VAFLAYLAKWNEMDWWILEINFMGCDCVVFSID
jgi:hypothetical protein